MLFRKPSTGRVFCFVETAGLGRLGSLYGYDTIRHDTIRYGTECWDAGVWAGWQGRAQTPPAYILVLIRIHKQQDQLLLRTSCAVCLSQPVAMLAISSGEKWFLFWDTREWLTQAI